MTHVKTTLLVSTVLILTACAHGTSPPGGPRGGGKIETPEVRLQVQQGELRVVGPENQKCQGNAAAKKGCIFTDLDDISFVKFELQGSGQYDFSKLWICPGENKPDPQAPNCTLSEAQRKEFLVITDAGIDNPGTNGEADLGDVDAFFLLNQNSFEATYYYMIEACTNSGTCAPMDPRLRNRGRTVTR